MAHIVIVHGWSGSPEANWFGWLRDTLVADGHAVHMPQMPQEDFPQVATWTRAIAAVVPAPDQQTFFVGHSLGNMAILRYIQSLPYDARVGGMLLVASYARPIGIPFLDQFLADPVDYAKVKTIVGATTLIASDNDPYVPLAASRDMAQALAADLRIISGAGHINDVSGYTQLEEGYAILRTMMRNGVKK